VPYYSPQHCRCRGVKYAVLAAGSSVLFQQIENGITLGAMYALVALGYTLVYGIIELINFAHGDVFMWSTVVILAVAQALGLNHPYTGLALIGILLMLIVIGMAVSATLTSPSSAWPIAGCARRRGWRR